MRLFSSQSRFLFRLSAVVSLAVISGCLNVPDAPKGLTVLATVSGNNQTIVIGASSVAPLIVRAYDEQGAPMPNVVVSWAIAQGSGSLSVATSTTNAGGEASTIFSPGNTTGIVYVLATADPLTVTFTEMIVPAG